MGYTVTYSENFERDWSFYLAYRDRFTFCGSEVPLMPLDPEGPTAKEAFYSYDTYGKRSVTCCSEPDLLHEVMVCKASVNFNIKLWASNFVNMMEGPDYYFQSYTEPPAPDWMRQAFVQQVIKMHGDHPFTVWCRLMREYVEAHHGV